MYNLSEYILEKLYIGKGFNSSIFSRPEDVLDMLNREFKISSYHNYIDEKYKKYKALFNFPKALVKKLFSKIDKEIDLESICENINDKLGLNGNQHIVINYEDFQNFTKNWQKSGKTYPCLYIYLWEDEYTYGHKYIAAPSLGVNSMPNKGGYVAMIDIRFGPTVKSQSFELECYYDDDETREKVVAKNGSIIVNAFKMLLDMPI